MSLDLSNNGLSSLWNFAVTIYKFDLNLLDFISKDGI